MSDYPCGFIKRLLMLLIMPYEFTDSIMLDFSYAITSSS